MTLGSSSNDKFRAVTRTLTSSGSATRVRCVCCNRISSLGQYPVGSNICIKCKPMPAGWRRGDINIIGEFK